MAPRLDPWSHLYQIHRQRPRVIEPQTRGLDLWDALKTVFRLIKGLAHPGNDYL